MKLIAGLVFSCLLSLQAFAAEDVLPLRLPSGVTPTAYQLALTVDPNQERHQGEVGIDVTITQPGTVIRLNAAEITVTSARLELGQLAGVPTPFTDALLGLSRLHARGRGLYA